MIEARFAEGGEWGEWQSLADWSINTNVGILTTALVDEGSRTFSLQYRMSAGAGNEARGKTISGLQWDFVGRTP